MGFVPAVNFLSPACSLNKASQGNFLAEIVSGNLLSFSVRARFGSVTRNKGYKTSPGIWAHLTYYARVSTVTLLLVKN